jgi:hypothetical protein
MHRQHRQSMRQRFAISSSAATHECCRQTDRRPDNDNRNTRRCDQGERGGHAARFSETSTHFHDKRRDSVRRVLSHGQTRAPHPVSRADDLDAAQRTALQLFEHHAHRNDTLVGKNVLRDALGERFDEIDVPARANATMKSMMSA